MIISALALYFRRQIKHILGNVRVFFIFMRKRQLREYIVHKRDELVVEVAKMVRLANKLTRSKNAENA